MSAVVKAQNLLILYPADKRTSKVSEKDRKIGHRRINEEGEVSYKKIQSNQLIASIQLGIQVRYSTNTKPLSVIFPT